MKIVSLALHSKIVSLALHSKIVSLALHSKNFKALRADLQGLCPIFKPQAIFKAQAIFKRSDLQGAQRRSSNEVIFKALRADLQTK